MFVSNAAFALPDFLTFYSPNPAGAQTTACRTLAKLYDEKYASTSVIFIKPGVGGVLAMKEMLANEKFSLLCSGISESVINTSLYPGHEEAHKQLTVVAVVAISPVFFITGANNKTNTIEELFRTKDSVSVGYHSNSLQFVAKTALPNKILWVPYKQASDALPSLVDGTLDLYVDGGGLTPIVESGRLKNLGRINGDASALGPEITQQYSEAAKLPIVLALSTSVKNSFYDIEEFNKRLLPLTKHPEFISAMQKIGNKPTHMSVSDSNKLIVNFKEKFYK